MSDTRSVAGGTTVFGGDHPANGSSTKKPVDLPLGSDGVYAGKSTTTYKDANKSKAPFVIAGDYMDDGKPYFIKVEKDGVVAALQKLDLELRNSGQNRLISRKKPTDWIGKEITPGNIGLVNHGGLPKLITRPGRYPGFPFRNWWARQWHGTKGLSDTVVEFLGLTILQVSQNQAAVISDPQNHIFVVKNAGFVALALEGSYTVLAVVDQTHLPNKVKDPVTKQILGATHEVKMKSTISGTHTEYVVALFLDIPANNCAVLQRGDDLELLGAGQHYITNPNVTLRGLYTCGENQIEMPTKDIYTRDQVPVSLTIYLKWQLTSPLMLTTHGYNTPYDALRDKAQSVLTQIVSHLDYSAMVKQRSLGGDHMKSENDDPSAAFLDALRTQAMDELHQAALEYGIVLKDLAVIDRQFKGDVAHQMEKLTTRALQTQVEAANVDRENSNKIKQEEGALSVARIKAQTRNTQADSDAYNAVTTARAAAQALQIETEARADATRLIAKAEADAIRLRALADADVKDHFAQEMELRRLDVERVRSYGNKTIFVPTAEAGARAGDHMAFGLAAAMGGKEGK
ncbi:band 7 domain-containing protein [Hysterangium stoloniferum]|nr:band 7 domain-containing protein [Hysterangium stoloniferum]